MRNPLATLGLAAATAAATALTGAAAVSTLGAAGATPAPCAPIPQDRIDSAIDHIAPPLPGARWQPTAHGGSVDCTLNWVKLDTPGGTGSSPVQVLLFDHQKFAGTPTPKGDAFTEVLGSSAPGQTTIRFKWLNPGDPNAAPTGQADVRFQTMPQSPPRPLDPIPGPVAD
ncbi:LppP/LprE family lipoprotein [Tsukamurella sp. 1534]|uniref:LppP/LprE family lipoprotein n=1 Tax=Tsukamurella sp. 1534 TaxID=1151061 RepID=UPI0002DA2D6A|nr:LppP/LprE family lipoprotein [Tsukamurella sp. 1534]